MPYSNREKYLSMQRSYYKKDPETYKWRVRLGKYGITKQEFFDLVDSQDNKCALCNRPFQGIWGNDMHVDHDHETNKIRGILCMPCNVALGMLGDNEIGLTRALAYVKGELN